MSKIGLIDGSQWSVCRLHIIEKKGVLENWHGLTLVGPG
jgi:hypothetical protein